MARKPASERLHRTNDLIQTLHGDLAFSRSCRLLSQAISLLPYPRLNMQVRCQFKGHGFIARTTMPDYDRRVTRSDLVPDPFVTNSCVSVNLRHMIREISAGGVVMRHTPEGWQLAVIEPQKESAVPLSDSARQKTSQKMLLALPKGLVDRGEKPVQAATREVA